MLARYVRVADDLVDHVAPHWPAACTKIGCINKHLNALHAENLALAAVNKKQNQTINELVGIDSCLFDYPVSLDVSDDFFLTASGDTPFVWAVFDACNTGPAVKTRAPVRFATPLAAMLTRIGR